MVESFFTGFGITALVCSAVVFLFWGLNWWAMRRERQDVEEYQRVVWDRLVATVERQRTYAEQLETDITRTLGEQVVETFHDVGLPLFVAAMKGQAGGDHLPVLVYCDWLDENGHEREASRIRGEVKDVQETPGNRYFRADLFRAVKGSMRCVMVRVQTT